MVTVVVNDEGLCHPLDDEELVAKFLEAGWKVKKPSRKRGNDAGKAAEASE